MASFIFTAAKLKWLKDQLNYSNNSFTIVPVEAEPLPSYTTLSSITVTKDVSNNYLWKRLVDIGGSNANRFIQNANGGTEIHMVFEPVIYPAVTTYTNNPIVGFVILNGSSTPNSSSEPVFYLERLNETSGLPEAFQPDGITALAPDLTTYPVLKSIYSGNIFDSWRWKMYKDQVNTSSTSFYVALLESAPTKTMSTFGDLVSPTNILAKNGADNSLTKKLNDIDGTYNNRFKTVGATAVMVFDDLVWPALSTTSGNPITHYCLVEASYAPTNFSQLACWGELETGGVITPFVPDGVKNFQLECSKGIGFKL